MTNIIFTGIRENVLGLDHITEKALLAAKSIVTRGGVVISNEGKKNFRSYPGGQTVSRRTGRTYYKGAPNFPASPPLPTNRSGNLRNSIRLLQVTPTDGGWQSQTGPTMKYAAWVNYGTSRAREFPFFTTGVENSETRIREIAEEEWSRVND